VDINNLNIHRHCLLSVISPKGSVEIRQLRSFILVVVSVYSLQFIATGVYVTGTTVTYFVAMARYQCSVQYQR
jgi:hypothetical protein